MCGALELNGLELINPFLPFYCRTTAADHAGHRDLNQLSGEHIPSSPEKQSFSLDFLHLKSLGDRRRLRPPLRVLPHPLPHPGARLPFEASSLPQTKNKLK